MCNLTIQRSYIAACWQQLCSHESDVTSLHVSSERRSLIYLGSPPQLQNF